MNLAIVAADYHNLFLSLCKRKKNVGEKERVLDIGEMKFQFSSEGVV